MIDIHCHLLPGIDDGPDTLEEALAMAEYAVADGITHSILTPHMHPGRWDNDSIIIEQAVAAFRAELQARNIPLHLGFAAEVRLSDLVLSHMQAGKIPFLGHLNGYSLLLLEFPHGQIIPGSDRLVQWLDRQGVRPVLAHPERNKAIMRDLRLLEPFLEAGCLLQVTASSLTGGFGAVAEAVALQLLQEDLITFVASDAHNLKARPPRLSAAFDLVSNLKGRDKAEHLFVLNQQNMLKSAPEHSAHA